MTLKNRSIAVFILFVFICPSLFLPAGAEVSMMPWMPKPGQMVGLSPRFTPAYLEGIIIHPEDPLKFDFIVYKGDRALNNDQKYQEYGKLIKYFMASLAVPDEDQWVNLSPYEKNRIIKVDFGRTEMGRDLLAQDYLLKQISSSLIYPESNLGRKFWSRVFVQAQQRYGTSNIPVNTFNKVWILPDSAVIYEKGNAAYVLKDHLRVMLEEDYLALAKHLRQPGDMFNSELGRTCPQAGCQAINPMNVKAPQVNPHSTDELSFQILRQIILPELEREINEDQNFAPIRQVYSGMLLAAWYKRALKESLMSRIYADKSRLKGIDQDPRNNEIIYQRYLEAYRKGVFNFIKEDEDKFTHLMIPRKYFSGGSVGFNNREAGVDFSQVVDRVKTLDAAERRFLGQSSRFDLAQVVEMEKVQTLSRRQLLLGAGSLAVTALSPASAQGAGDLTFLDDVKLDMTALENLLIAVATGKLTQFDENVVVSYILKFADPKNPNAVKDIQTLQRMFGMFLEKAYYTPNDEVNKTNHKDLDLNNLEGIIRIAHLAGALYKIKPELFWDSKKNPQIFYNVINSHFVDSQVQAIIRKALDHELDLPGLDKTAPKRVEKLKTDLNQRPVLKSDTVVKTPKADVQRTAVPRAAVQRPAIQEPEVIRQPMNIAPSNAPYVRRRSSGPLDPVGQGLDNLVNGVKTLPRNVGKFFDGLNKAFNDNAQMVNQPQDHLGGIDFNAAHLNLQIRRDGNGIALPVDQQDLQNIQIDGLTPVILSIKPAPLPELA